MLRVLNRPGMARTVAKRASGCSAASWANSGATRLHGLHQPAVKKTKSRPSAGLACSSSNSSSLLTWVITPGQPGGTRTRARSLATNKAAFCTAYPLS